MLTITGAVHDAMVAHALHGFPHEACGLFAGAPGSATVDTFFPMRNAAESSQIYRLDGEEMLAVERRADDAGLLVLGVMHSHTHTSAYPSPTDVDDASRFDPFGAWYYVIVSLKFDDPVLRAYRIADGKIDEVEVVVTQ